jgi:hypothetical protein
MKYFIMSVALVMAMAVPTWSQAQTPPPAHSGHHATTRHHVFRHYSMADRLNAEELAVLERRGASVHRMPSGGKQLTDPR